MRFSARMLHGCRPVDRLCRRYARYCVLLARIRRRIASSLEGMCVSRRFAFTYSVLSAFFFKTFYLAV